MKGKDFLKKYVSFMTGRIEPESEPAPKQSKKKRKRSDDRNVDLSPTMLKAGGLRRIIHAGDSLETVPCPNWLRRRMEHNIRKCARAANIIFPLRRKVARELLEEFNIPFIRPSKRRRPV